VKATNSLLFSLFLFSLWICPLNLQAGTAVSDSSQTYFSSDSIFIDTIVLVGNEKTKDYVVLRELSFEPKTWIPSEEFLGAVNQSEIQLGKSALFTEYRIEWSSTSPENSDSIPASGSSVKIFVFVKERWYIFPAPIFELADRNFNVWWQDFNHDFARTNYGLNMIFYNLSGHKDDLETVTQWGFTPKFEIFYNRPYIGKSPNHGLGFELSLSGNKKTPYINQGDKEIFLETEDFGLVRFRTGIQYLNRIGNVVFQEVEAKYVRNRVNDSIDMFNPAFFGREAAQSQDFFTLSYTLNLDRVDFRNYPLRGSWSNLIVRKLGLGIFDDVNLFNVTVQHNQYFALPWDLYLSFMAMGKFSFGQDQPYFNQEGFGFCQDFVRGYELYVIDGQHYGLGKFNFKRKLFDFNIPNPLADIGYAGVPFAVYLKTYGDIGYIHDDFFTNGNALANSLLLGGGVGFDVVTFYDWVFRFEYSFNRLGENGLFLHWMLDLNTYEDCRLW
jgi:hypothetical protein